VGAFYWENKMDWKKESEKLKLDENKSWKETADIIHDKYFPNEDKHKIYEKVRGHVRHTERYKQLKNNTQNNNNVPTENIKITSKNGESTFEGKIIELMSGEPIKPEILLKAYNIDTTKFEVVCLTANLWQSQVKDGKKLDMYQSKLTVRPIRNKEISLEDIDEYFNNKKTYKVPTTDYKFIDDGEILEVTYVDPHNGLLAWRQEVGEDYDLKIARQRFIDCAYDIKERCKSKKIKAIKFCMLGDVLHTNNDSQTTEKGTFQQVDGRYPKIVDYTIDTIVDVLTILKNIAPVEVKWVSGNHSRTSEYIIMKCVEKCFTDVQFDITPDPVKYLKIGNSLIGLSHGDVPKKNVTAFVDKKARQIGGIEYIEQHCGHYHSEITTIVNGIVVRYLPSLCSASFYEHQQNYLSVKGMICMLWSETRGQREMWINNI